MLARRPALPASARAFIVAAMEDPSEQLVELEIKLAYQERQVRELDSLVRGLAARLDATERDVASLKKTLEPAAPVNEPPPHY